MKNIFFVLSILLSGNFLLSAAADDTKPPESKVLPDGEKRQSESEEKQKNPCPEGSACQKQFELFLDKHPEGTQELLEKFQGETKINRPAPKLSPSSPTDSWTDYLLWTCDYHENAAEIKACETKGTARLAFLGCNYAKVGCRVPKKNNKIVECDAASSTCRNVTDSCSETETELALQADDKALFLSKPAASGYQPKHFCKVKPKPAAQQPVGKEKIEGDSTQKHNASKPLKDQNKGKKVEGKKTN